MIKTYSLLAGVIAFVAVSFVFINSSPDTTVRAEAEKQAAALMDSFGSNTTPPPQTPETASGAESTSAVQVANTQVIPRAMKATLHTNLGPITIEFMGADAPNTVANFEKLAREGFYNGTKFHRVIEGFMIQGGDPLSKDEAQQARWGSGGPGYNFNDEIHANNRNEAGTISMANAGPNTNGSQFFINTANNNFLDGKHTVFGVVTAGMDVVRKIETTATGPQDRPVEPMVIERVDLE